MTKNSHNFLSMLMKKKALVTGANGFVGSNLVRALLKKGYEVTCLVRSTSNLSSIENLPVSLKNADYHSLSSLREACEDQEIIFHIAAKVREINEKRYFDANVELTKNLLESMKSSTVKKFVFLSTQAAAGPADGLSPKTETCSCNPVSYYGKSKLEAERVVHEECPVPWVIIRPPSVYGPRDRDFLLYFKLVNKHLAPMAGSKKKYFSLVYVEDLVRMIIMAAENERGNNE
ncbi:NAD(P)-dependent oxidoreductase, partial [bacterium]|nr:NAD(P)-dependent oxidoreductase [bacterium]